MNCVIPGINIKVFGKGILALSKIGNELIFEPTPNALYLRSVHAKTLAYATINFRDIFFSEYEVISSPSNLENLICNLPMKAMLDVFKPHSTKDKKPDHCKIELEHDATQIMFKFKYKHNIVVVRQVHLADGAITNIIYDRELSKNRISIAPNILYKVLSNFQLSKDDISLDFTINKVVIRNYLIGDTNVAKGIRSQVTLNSIDFYTFNIEDETCITFSLKVFKAAVHFAESLSLNVILTFRTTGKPAEILINNTTFEVSFIVATVRENNNDTQSSVLTRKSLTKKTPLCEEVQQALDSINWDTAFNDEETEAPSKKLKRDQENRICPNRNNNTINNNNNNTNPVKSTTVQIDNMHLNNSDCETLSPVLHMNEKVRRLLQRCYEPTFCEINPDVEILAPNSDVDSDNE